MKLRSFPFFLFPNNGSTGSCISPARDEYRTVSLSFLSHLIATALSTRRSIIRFHSKPDFSRRKIHEIPTSSLSLIVFFFCRVLLHRWASVNVAAGSSLGVSGLWIYVRRSCVHPCHSSCIQKCGNRDILFVCVSLKKMRLILNIFYKFNVLLQKQEIIILNIALIK